MPAETRVVTITTLLYLPGGTHPFRPGSTLPLPLPLADALEAAGHLAKPEPAGHADPHDALAEAYDGTAAEPPAA